MTDAAPSLNDVAQVLATTPKFAELKTYFEGLKAAAVCTATPAQCFFVALSTKHVCAAIALITVWPPLATRFTLPIVALLLASAGRPSDAKRACEHLARIERAHEGHNSANFVSQMTAMIIQQMTKPLANWKHLRPPTAALTPDLFQAHIGPQARETSRTKWPVGPATVYAYCARTHTVLANLAVFFFAGCAKVDGRWETTGGRGSVTALLPVNAGNNGLDVTNVTVLPLAVYTKTACFGDRGSVFVAQYETVIWRASAHDASVFVNCRAPISAMAYSEDLGTLAVLTGSNAVKLFKHNGAFEVVGTKSITLPAHPGVLRDCRTVVCICSLQWQQIHD